jgi:putative ABC transport system permease protein
MLLIARKNLFSERLRLCISVGGVALAVFLISMLLSLYRGWEEKVGGFVENSNVDMWIASEGAQDFLAAASLLPTEGDNAVQARNYLNSSQAVETWSPLIVRSMEGVRVVKLSPTKERVGKKMDIHFIGFDPTTRLGGPIDVVAGSDTPGDGEVIIDQALGKRYGIRVRDLLRAGGKDWKVVGMSKGGDFVATQTVFVSHQQAQEALSMTGITTFYVLQLTPNADPVKFKTDLEILSSQIVVHTREDFAAQTRRRVLSDVLPILFVVLALAFIVGLAVAGLTIYTATIEKTREFGILKAVGFRNGYLYRLVFEQSAVTAFLGFLVGMGLTLVLGPFASDLVPQFVLFTRWQDVLVVAGVTMGMAIIAGYIPVRRLAAIDPVSVFKG